jgi:DNA repair exonuclease SbcCD ATPase subunit
MLKIKTVTLKNFLSVGNATQAINFDRKDLTLVLGENLDLGGDDAGARNGVGKSAIMNAVSYGLFGQALNNIKRDNLINKTNAKNMLVTVEFEKNGVEYRIERGRKPAVMKFWVAGSEKEITDEAQGDSRETQADIEQVLGMKHDMFQHIIALNTYTEPFLNMKANDQRTIIEQLLGITLLSEKAEALKEQIRLTKDAISQEEFRIKAVTDANKRIEEQIESLRKRKRLWEIKHQEDLESLAESLASLLEIDIDAEIQAHKDLAAYNEKNRDITELQSAIKRCKLDEDRETRSVDRLAKEIQSLENHTCHTCGQEFHDAKHEQVLAEHRLQLEEAAGRALAANSQWLELSEALNDLGELGVQPKIFYDHERDAYDHRSTVNKLQEQIAAKSEDIDPYSEQIEEMTAKAIEEIDYGILNDLSNVRDHQEFLLKLLTNKDSFIRKSIIDQNLSYLNGRLGQYLDRIGLPHTVKFNNDLTVSISELGRDLDPGNLSRGETTRLILSLSLAFRDVFENLYQPINLVFIDELLDNGLDAIGVENAITILKKLSRNHNKSVWLVSHRDELSGRVNNTLKVIKENGYTRFDTDLDIK